MIIIDIAIATLSCIFLALFALSALLILDCIVCAVTALFVRGAKP